MMRKLVGRAHRAALGFGRDALRVVIGYEHQSHLRRAQRAREKLDELNASLSERSKPVGEEALEDLEARVILLRITEGNEYRARPIWRRPDRVLLTLIIAVTLIGLVGLLVEAPSMDIEVEASVDQFRAVIGTGELGESVSIGLQDFQCRRIEIIGLPLGDAEASESISPGGTLSFARGSDGTEDHLLIPEIRLPRGALLAVESMEDKLTFRLGRPMAPAIEEQNGRFRAVISVPSTYNAAIRRDGRWHEFPLNRSPLGPAEPILEAPLADRSIELRLTLDLDATAPVTHLGFQGIDLVDFRFGDYLGSVDARARSYILGGELRFPGKAIESLPLRSGEVLSLSDLRGHAPEGQLLHVRHINRRQSEQSADQPLPLQHLQILWAGRAEAIDLGRESRRDSRMPNLIFSWVGSRQQLYLIGVVIYAGIIAYSLIARSRPGSTDVTNPSELMNL
jgi:hypothetical protein